MMKKLIATMLLFVATPALANDIFAPDKISHFGTSAAWGLVAGTVTYHYAESMGPVERTLTSTALGTIPGLAVEIGDEFSKGNRFGWGDLAADGTGAFAGAIAAELINGQFWVSASGKQIRLVGKW